MQVKINISDKTLRYCIGGAQIDYWAAKAHWNNADLALSFIDAERDGKAYSLHSEDFARGLNLMAEHSPKHFANLLSNNYDCFTGDVLIQYAAFGKLIYG